MPENEEKSLDHQIKEAELAKLKAETEEIEMRSREVRVLGVPLVQVIFGGIVVGFVLLNYIRPVVDLNTEINTKEKEVNKITGRLERIKIEARSKDLEDKSESLRIEQADLTVRSKLMGIFGTLDASEYAST